jgi:hypothetical protein
MSKFGNIFKNYRFTLNSRILLYFILILSIGDLIYFSLAGEMMFFFIYLAVGYLTSFFSKNMIVILVVAMTVTHVLRFGKRAGNEGMENQDDPITAFEEMKKDYDGLESKEPFNPYLDRTKLETAPANIDAASPSPALQQEQRAPVLKNQNASSENVSKVAKGPATTVVAKGPSRADSAGPAPISTIDKLKKSTAQIQKIKDNLHAAREKEMATPISAFGNTPASSLKNLMNTKVDSALAINNSTPVISGFENLDAQTKKLLNTQQELMSNMENLSPLLAQAEQFMAKFQGLAKA